MVPRTITVPERVGAVSMRNIQQIEMSGPTGTLPEI
jgi:hypothetical protein